MRFCIYTDVHFCEHSSIVRSNGDKFSTRLENLIASLNWAEQQALEQGCSEIICLGDFFDSPDLNSRELTALQEIKWAKLPHTFIVGNHEASVKSLKYNSVSALAKNGFDIIRTPKVKVIENCDLLFIPYFLDSDRKSISDYWRDFSDADRSSRKRIVFSHNDVKGIRYGAFESKEGFDVDDIQNNCNIFINGHLHNGQFFCKNGLNIGNLTGQNFGEDAFEYSHGIFILDTQTSSLDYIENPFALNFYKFNIVTVNDIHKLFAIKENSVLSIKCAEVLKPDLEKALEQISQKIVEKRVILIRDVADVPQDTATELSGGIDHLTRFIEFCRNRLDNSEILEEELSEVCK